MRAMRAMRAAMEAATVRARSRARGVVGRRAGAGQLAASFVANLLGPFPGLVGLGIALAMLGAAPGRARAGEAEPITVFAAASMTDAVASVAQAFEAKHGVAVRLNLGSSSTLARQISAGAPFDVFLSANPAWADHVAKEGLFAPDSRQVFAGNGLVLIQPKSATQTPTIRFARGFDLAAAFAGRLALGDPDHVPAGIYAKAALSHYGWWESLRGRVLPAANVRAALLAVERGEAPLGIVYATDAARSRGVRVVATVPPAAHPPIAYVLGASKETGAEGRAFVAFLTSPAGQAILRQFGFTPPPPGGAASRRDPTATTGTPAMEGDPAPET